MSVIERYEAYAAKFEDVYASDNWDLLREYFTENAVYEGIGDPFAFRVEGIDSILKHLKEAVNGFDRKFTSRKLEQRAPIREDGNTVTMEWRAIYSIEGAPELHMEGVEVAEFDGDRIIRLEDTFSDTAAAAVGAWMAEHGAKLEG